MTIIPDTKTKELLAYLARGGKYQNFWYLSQDEKKKETVWFPAGNPPQVKNNQNAYFGIHPTGQPGTANERSKITTITFVNCLFAEFDTKDGATLNKIENLDYQPQVIVSSGGGWHCYWLLKDPFDVTETNRELLRSTQARWVDYVGGDPGAKDLARVLRIPGSKNYKYIPPRPVEFIRCDFMGFYTIKGLSKALPVEAVKIQPPANTHERAPGDGTFWLNKALEMSHVGNRNSTALWLAGQLRDDRFPQSQAESVMIEYARYVPEPDTFQQVEALAACRSAYKAPPRDPAKAAGKTMTAAPTQTVTQPHIQPRRSSWTLSDLYKTEFPEPNWIVQDIIQEGLVMLAGRPKIGKSWLNLQTAHSVSMGGMLFGKKVIQGKVLYLALEDTARRLKSRAQKMGIPNGANILFELDWKPLHQGGIEDLSTAIERHAPRLVVIDTLARSLPGVNGNDENPIGPIMDTLASLARDHGITILLSDHTRKSNGILNDPIDDVMGSTAKSRALDAVLAIYKEQGKAGATLKGRGRETEELDLALAFDQLTGCWQNKGDTSILRIVETHQEIIDFLASEGPSPEGRITKALGKDRGNMYKILQDLVNMGDLNKTVIQGKVFYEKV